MNRDQIITESIQKLLKMLLEKEKTTKNIHCIAGPSANSARGLFDLLLLGLEPDSHGQATEKARRSIAPRSAWAARRPKMPRRDPGRRLGSDGRPRVSPTQNPGDAGALQTLEHFLLPLSLSTETTAATVEATAIAAAEE